MKDIIKNKITFVCSLVGIIIGIIWIMKTQDIYEPLIIIIVSSLETFSFLYLNSEKPISLPASAIETKFNNNVNVNLSIDNHNGKQNSAVSPESRVTYNRSEVIQLMKSKVNILFIDDDKNFEIVKILKNSGWKNTKSITDVKTIDAEIVFKSQVIFVDINGVGKIMKLEFEGLDLAFMIKQKYQDKCIIIYSANRNTNAFHNAWDICDYRLEKNALPTQFISLVEDFSYENYPNK